MRTATPNPTRHTGACAQVGHRVSHPQHRALACPIFPHARIRTRSVTQPAHLRIHQHKRTGRVRRRQKDCCHATLKPRASSALTGEPQARRSMSNKDAPRRQRRRTGEAHTGTCATSNRLLRDTATSYTTHTLDAVSPLLTPSQMRLSTTTHEARLHTPQATNLPAPPAMRIKKQGTHTRVGAHPRHPKQPTGQPRGTPCPARNTSPSASISTHPATTRRV